MEFEPRSWRGVLDTTLCDKVCQWLATGPWVSLYNAVSSTNKTDHNITEILLKVALNTITLWYKVKFVKDTQALQKKSPKTRGLCFSINHRINVHYPPIIDGWVRLGLWCLTPLSTIFQLYCGQFYWWRKLRYTEKPMDLSFVKLVYLWQILLCITEFRILLKWWEMKNTNHVASNSSASERSFFLKLKFHSDKSFIWMDRF
jgi:hypothetical protein